MSIRALKSGYITYSNGEWSTFSYKLPTTKDNNPILSYSVEETSPTNYAVSYLVNGEPISDDNPITSGADQTVTIVNAERVPEGEIHVKKVWEGAEESEKQPVTIELWAVKDDTFSTDEKVNVYCFASYDPNSYRNTTPIEINKGGGVRITNNSGWNWSNAVVLYKIGQYSLIEYNRITINSGESYDLTGITEDTVIVYADNSSNTQYISCTELVPEIIPTDNVYRTAEIEGPEWTTKFDHLPYGYKYYIKETNAPLGFKVFYSYTDTEGNTYSGETAQEGSMTGTIQGGAVVTNKKDEIKGSIKVTKIVKENGNASNLLNDRTIKIGLYDKDPGGGDEFLKTADLTITSSTTSEVLFSDLTLGTYYVFELDDEDKPVKNGGMTGIDGKVFTVSEETPNVTLTEANADGEVTITNEYETVEVNADKTWLDIDTAETDPATAEVMYGYENESWKVTFKNLPKYDETTKAEIVYKIKETIPYTGFTNVNQDGVASGGTISNKENTFVVTKIWKDSTDHNVEWANDIVIALRMESSGAGTHTYTYTISKNGTGFIATPADNEAPIPVITGNANDGYSISWSNLDVSYTYSVTEETVDGYKDPAYATKSATTGDGAQFKFTDDSNNRLTSAGNKGYIINTPEDAVSLPSTGGSGTGMFYGIGIALLALAGALLFIRRRSMRNFSEGRW